MTANGPPPIPACKLWERTSAGGHRYLMGRLGGLRVLVFENRDRQAAGDATHVLLFAQAPDYPAAGAQAQQRAPLPTVGSEKARAYTTKHGTPAPADGAPFHDDEPLQ
jgi:hypothetical protein